MRDHPRVCGEKCGPLRWGPEMPGSPPRMRGKASRGGLILKDDGITPAYAGKSIQTFQFVQYHRDHPRVCGEKLSISSAHISQTGSPPRMRGKARMILIHVNGERITPACAGKRRRAFLHGRPGWDHPRVCGEKSFSKSPASSRRGSPPRVRGKGGIGIYSTFTHGITPACAGKSCSGCCSCSCAGDHPRVCGEKSKEVAEYASKAGSPPRVRGKVEPFKGSMYQSRITPACAGKSTKQEKHRDKAKDHPRVCGEKCHG